VQGSEEAAEGGREEGRHQPPRAAFEADTENFIKLWRPQKVRKNNKNWEVTQERLAWQRQMK
jgi:hypothetical protein